MDTSNLLIKFARIRARLSECADPQLPGVGHGNRGRSRLLLGLHHDMAASTTHLDKPVSCQDGTGLLPGEYAELTQPTPQGV
jgi:hypothetical protein